MLKKLFAVLLLVLIAFIFLFPIIWMLSTSFKGSEDIFRQPPQLIPQRPNLENFTGIWNAIDFSNFFLNSFIVALFSVAVNVLISSLTGFALARLHFRGKKIVFIIVLLAIIIPKEILIIPLYHIVVQIRLVDSLAGVALPFAVDGLSIYLMRQAYLSIPSEIEEAARMDSAGIFVLWWKVLQPMVLPNIAVIAIFTFISSWGDFLWPLVVLQDPQNYTLQVGLQSMLGTFVNNFRFVAAGSILSLLPVVIVFVIFQRFIVKGLFLGSGK